MSHTRTPLTGKKPLLTLLTIATRLDRYAPEFLKSCRRFGYEPLILGEGKRWTGFGLKLALLRRALLESVAAISRIVLYADAHDSLILCPASQILKQFTKIDHPLVFSAEKNCYPDPWRARSYPQASTPWRYLNSGGFIGEAALIREHLEDIPRAIPLRLDDQRHLQPRDQDPSLHRARERLVGHVEGPQVVSAGRE